MKLKKIVITTGYQCDNDCLFCNVGDKDKTYNRSSKDIENILIKEYKNGFRAAEFIGGEATNRKDIISLIKKAKRIGYKQISIESNGRAFSDDKFTRDAIWAGLNRIMFSIHGHNAQIHDRLTRTKGSFNQAVKGLRNVNKYPEVSVYTNFVINKVNFRHIEKYLKFILQFNLGVALLSFVRPTGNALINQKKIIPKVSEAAFYLREALKKLPTAKVKIQHIPLCLLETQKELSTRAIDVKRSFMNSENKKTNFTKEIRRSKIQPRCCKECILSNDCDGIWKEYYNIYGSKELKAVKYSV